MLSNIITMQEQVFQFSPFFVKAGLSTNKEWVLPSILNLTSNRSARRSPQLYVNLIVFELFSESDSAP